MLKRTEDVNNLFLIKTIPIKKVSRILKEDATAASPARAHEDASEQKEAAARAFLHAFHLSGSSFSSETNDAVPESSSHKNESQAIKKQKNR